MAERDDAIAEVKRLAQTEAEPAVSDDDVATFVDRHRRATVWAAATEVALGAVIVPTVRDGRQYRATRAGTTGATEPTFNTAVSGVTSDGEVVWEEYGPAFSGLYDVERAVWEVWRVKKAKASEYLGADERHVFEHCERMERQFAPAGMA